MDRSWFGISPIAALPAPGWADERGDDAEIQQAHIAQIAAHLKSAYSVLSEDYKKFQGGYEQYFAKIQNDLVKAYEDAKTQDERNNVLKRIRGANFDKLSYHPELVPYWNQISNQALLARILTESGTALSDADRTALAEKFIGGCDEEQALKVLRQGKLDRNLKEKLLSCVKSAKGRLEFVDDKDICKLAIGGISAQDMAQYLIQNKNLRNMPNLSSRLTDFVNKIEGKETRNNVLDALLDAWKDAKDDDAKQCRAVISEIAKDDDQVHKVLKNLHHGLLMQEWHDLVDRITESATADMVYENLLVDKESARLASDELSLSKLLPKIAKKISAEKSSEIVKRLQSEKKDASTCSICGLYLGMNALDGLVLAAETKNDVEFSVWCDSGKESTGVSREDIKVQTMYFSVKYLASALQCEDAEVLYCMIHRYVMNKSGKAHSFEYANLTNVETQSSKHWSLVYGTSYTYTTWQTYTNSKLGVKFWFDEKNGVVKITQI